MRLWHKYLVPYLPEQQLLAQWRECCCIARNIFVNGTPNHVLVNEVMEYPDEDFNTYAMLVVGTMRGRGFEVKEDRYWRWRDGVDMVQVDRIFEKWHNDRYLKQCLYNLQEKYDRGGIRNNEWGLIYGRFKQYL